VTTTIISNIGEFYTGDLKAPEADISTLLIENDRIKAINPPADTECDKAIDAEGLAILPGLVDGHIHPVFGEWTPTQDTMGWIGNYMHGGSTTMISAGELHTPGLDYNNLSADLVTSLAEVTAATTARIRWSDVKVRHDRKAF
jgi:enamidase